MNSISIGAFVKTASSMAGGWVVLVEMIPKADPRDHSYRLRPKVSPRQRTHTKQGDNGHT